MSDWCSGPSAVASGSTSSGHRVQVPSSTISTGLSASVVAPQSVASGRLAGSRSGT
ncbi:MAG: hypothetical protein KC656_20035 [Myxococcales bacterium]|nr:hypothetical protein [Myxococcales bacterium]